MFLMFLSAPAASKCPRFSRGQGLRPDGGASPRPRPSILRSHRRPTGAPRIHFARVLLQGAAESSFASSVLCPFSAARCKGVWPLPSCASFACAQLEMARRSACTSPASAVRSASPPAACAELLAAPPMTVVLCRPRHAHHLRLSARAVARQLHAWSPDALASPEAERIQPACLAASESRRGKCFPALPYGAVLGSGFGVRDF